MNIKIVCSGKLKKDYIKEGVCDFSKRLSKYAKVEIIEVKDEKTADQMSDAESAAIKQKEGVRLLSHIADKSFVVCLDIGGKRLSTDGLADFILQRKMTRIKEIVFVIGGSIGLCPNVLKRADFIMSFSDLTFPHGLMRLILLEQLYRVERILSGEPYHK